MFLLLYISTNLCETTFKEHSQSFKKKSSPCSGEISKFVWRSQAHYFIQKSLLLAPILRQFNQVFSFLCHLLRSNARSFRWPLFPTKNPTYISLPSLLIQALSVPTTHAANIFWTALKLPHYFYTNISKQHVYTKFTLTCVA